MPPATSIDPQQKDLPPEVNSGIALPRAADTAAPMRPLPAPDNNIQPLHTQTQSTLAPTSEFVRYFLLAYPSRYLFRGLFGGLFQQLKLPTEDGVLRKTLVAIAKPGEWIHQHTNTRIDKESKFAIGYNAALGLGSMALTLSYAHMVKADIKNIFAEVVAEETGKPSAQITFADIKKSENKIIRATVNNYRSRTWSRLFTDLLFFPAAWSRQVVFGDLMVGVKSIHLFADTWKRTPTMFEDLVTFVNNKINPRNGLGQPINVGEIFDLFQHYTQIHQPDKMFRNVLSRDTSEAQMQAINQPIFTRITELMNLTYAYKHGDALQEEVAKADFALPKFIYMLGHDLIDPAHPVETLALIEVMNSQGPQGVKHAQELLRGGQSPIQVLEQFGLKLPAKSHTPVPAPGPNAVIAKGSTRQLDAAMPVTKIDLASIAHEGPARTAEIGV